MPLIDLLKNDPKYFYYGGKGFVQKSIPFGQDTPGGGDSGQPYNKSDINLADQIVRKDDDSYIRGGAYGAAKASSLDTIRIRKFLGSNPKGYLFLTKQVGLQFSNPKLETKQITLGNNTGFLGFASNVINAVSDNFGPTRIYNLGFNTLAQIPSTAYGQHFVRHGLLPVMDDEKKYDAVVKYNNENGSNRLLRLSDKFKLSDKFQNRSIENSVTQQLISRSTRTAREIGGLLTGLGSLIGGRFGNTVTRVGQGVTKVANVVSLFNNNHNLIIDDYAGGPGSTYGIGKTIIRRYDITENGDKIEAALKKSEQVTQQIKRIKGENQNALGDAYAFETSNIKKYNTLTNAISQLPKRYSEIPGEGYLQNNSYLFNPINSIDDSSKIGLDRNAPNFRYYGGTIVNRSQIVYNNTDKFSRIDSDILTIVLRIIDPFTLDEDPIYLSAYINGFRDNFTGNWDEISYNGRSENFYIYNKGKRDVSFNLQIPCFNKKELFEKHRALGQLASTTAGAYGPKNALGGVLIRLNVGRYLEGEYGILNSLSYDIPDNATWDIDNDAKLATTLNVSFNFTIIHQNLPQYKPQQGFFKYLPDSTKGYILKGKRDQSQQRAINETFVRDNDDNLPKRVPEESELPITVQARDFPKSIGSTSTDLNSLVLNQKLITPVTPSFTELSSKQKRQIKRYDRNQLKAQDAKAKNNQKIITSSPQSFNTSPYSPNT
jgi:hypothetical protein